jgi:hypothetical protein
MTSLINFLETGVGEKARTALREATTASKSSTNELILNSTTATVL